jgi:hypothetical protein
MQVQNILMFYVGVLSFKIILLYNKTENYIYNYIVKNIVKLRDPK